MGENSSKINKDFEKAFEAAAKNKRNFYIYKGVSNLNSEINKSVKAVEKDKKKKYIKSDSYVKWVSEKEKNTCEACRSKNGKIYKANELKGIWPVHPNCKCELVDILAINSEAIETNLLSGIGKSDIIKVTSKNPCILDTLRKAVSLLLGTCMNGADAEYISL